MIALIILLIILAFSDISITITRDNKPSWEFKWSIKKLFKKNE